MKLMNRILAVVLAISMLLPLVGDLSIKARAEETAPEITVTRANGEETTNIILEQDAKETLMVNCSLEECEYQWQILADIESDFWVDIYERNSESLEVSYAMVSNVLDDTGNTYVRCKITCGEDIYYTDFIGVSIFYTPVFFVPPTESEEEPLMATFSSRMMLLSDGNYVHITINYLDALTQNELFSPYTATLEAGKEFKMDVISPTYLGYAQFYDGDDYTNADPNNATDSAAVIKFDLDSVTSDIVINVYYKPIKVPYAVRFYFQNIYGEQYTENASLYKQDTAETGTIIDDATLVAGIDPAAIVGYTKLYHYPEAVAADGSTVFECYYDRNYYLIKFDLADGYGVEPIYARYGTPFVVNDPIKHGYVFAGWDLCTSTNPNGDGVADEFPATIPAENQSYKALWTKQETTYTVVYWKENPDDNGYSYWGRKIVKATSGYEVSGEDHKDLPAEMTDDADEFEYRYFTYDHADGSVIIDGDGSTVLNVYYKRNVYTLKFYYAKSTGTGENIRYYVAGGSTWSFADDKGTNENIAAMLNNVGSWGEMKAQPTLNATGVDRNYTTGSEEHNGFTYYYISFSAKYGADISNKWPLGVFDRVEATFTQNGFSHAYFSAWNVEHHTYYSSENSNKTMKGNYLRLNYQLLYDYRKEAQYGTSDKVCFLAFWENGCNGVGWNVPNQFLYRIWLPQLADASQYYILEQYDTCDNNGIANDADLANQTATAVEGFTYNRRSGSANNPAKDSYGRTSYIVDFYYTRNNYELTFVNHGTELTYKTASVPYEKSLKDYEFVPSYPTNLEKDAYVFKGWYTSPGCYDGTKVDFSTFTMPANDLKLYAKWELITRNLQFFLNYDAMVAYRDGTASLEQLKQQGLYIEERSVLHGHVLRHVDEPTPITEGGLEYDFSGWFTLELGEKKAYTPLDMPVNKDLLVFAEWGSHTPQPYVIHYVLQATETDAIWLAALNTASAGAPEENVRYTVTVDGVERSYVYVENYYHLCIADDTAGYGYQGSTRTFIPKAGDPYNQLYNAYNSGYYPTIASHSITMKYEENKYEARKNVFTFMYVNASNISYVVCYLDHEGNELHEPKTVTTSKAVVTERFVPIANYVSDAFYKRLVLAVVDDGSGNYISSPDNEIIFYYLKNDKTSFYAVHFMLQKLGTDGTNFEIDGTGHYEASSSQVEGVADFNSSVSIEPWTFSGFTVMSDATVADVEYVGDEEKVTTTKTTLADGKFSVVVQENGTDLYIFYKRNTYPYKVYYLQYGTDISNLNSLKYTDGSNGVLAKTKTGSEQEFGSVATEFSQKIEGYNSISKTQSITIREKDNTIIFYYTPLQYTAEYEVWDGGGGKLSKTSETIAGTSDFEGSTPTADKYYTFVGWYMDKECTIPVTDAGSIDGSTNHLLPTKANIKPSPDTNKFYAKFVPLYGSLTIERQNADDEGNGDQVFIYKVSNNFSEVFYVTVKGNSSTVITDVRYGEYTVEQIEDWSWRYSDAKASVELNAESATVTFLVGSAETKWLNGNSDVAKNKKN